MTRTARLVCVTLPDPADLECTARDLWRRGGEILMNED